MGSHQVVKNDPLLQEIRDVCTAAIEALTRADLVTYRALVEKETRLMQELRAQAYWSR